MLYIVGIDDSEEGGGGKELAPTPKVVKTPKVSGH